METVKMTGASLSTRVRAKPVDWGDTIRALAVLFKLRIVALLLLAAAAGAFLGAGGWPGLANLLLLLATGGMAAAGAWRDPAVLALALVLFLWTPSHFWSLAILCRRDYRRADTPMLPAQCAPRRAAWWVLLHSGATGAGALLLAAVPLLSWVYFLPTLLTTGYLLQKNVALVQKPTRARAREMFLASNVYLLLVLLFVLLATLVAR